jgi:hypothetical protein
MKFAIASSLLAIAATTSARPTTRDALGPYLVGSVLSIKDESVIYFQRLAARDGALWVNGGTAKYCPESADCPKNDYDMDFSFADGALSMGAVVPGGQQVYIAQNGRIEYTAAHSSSIPEGATTTGFALRDLHENDFAYLRHEDGMMACSTGKDDIYELFVKVPGFNEQDCVLVKIFTNPIDEPAAWQYM